MSDSQGPRIDNDNDKAPDHLKALLGRIVRVRSPRDSSRWHGRLASYFERPIIVVTERGLHGGIHGSGTILPASYPVEELPPLPKVDPCPTCGHAPFATFGDYPIILGDLR